jgi:hypothetical protein
VKGGRCQQYLSEVRGVCEVGEQAGRAWGVMGTGTQGRERGLQGEAKASAVYEAGLVGGGGTVLVPDPVATDAQL